MAGWKLNFNVIGNADHSSYPLRHVFRLVFLHIEGDVSSELDDAIPHGDSDISGIDVGVPFQFAFQVLFDVAIEFSCHSSF